MFIQQTEKHDSDCTTPSLHLVPEAYKLRAIFGPAEGRRL